MSISAEEKADILAKIDGALASAARIFPEAYAQAMKELHRMFPKEFPKPEEK